MTIFEQIRVHFVKFFVSFFRISRAISVSTSTVKSKDV